MAQTSINNWRIAWFETQFRWNRRRESQSGPRQWEKRVLWSLQSEWTKTLPSGIPPSLTFGFCPSAPSRASCVAMLEEVLAGLPSGLSRLCLLGVSLRTTGFAVGQLLLYFLVDDGRKRGFLRDVKAARAFNMWIFPVGASTECNTSASTVKRDFDYVL